MRLVTDVTESRPFLFCRAINNVKRGDTEGEEKEGAEKYDGWKADPVRSGQSQRRQVRKGSEYFQRLAAGGNPGTQYVLAQASRSGWLGLHRDPRQAFELFRKAAEKGWPRAMLALGDSYFKGIGVAKDRVEAVKWFQKAADQLDPIGLQYMAYIYEHGDGVPKDALAAYSWNLIARRYGRGVEIPEKLTVAQMDEAEKRTREFKIAHGIMDY